MAAPSPIAPPMQRAEHVRDGAVLEANLKADDRQAEHDAEERVDDRTADQRLQLVGGVADRSNKKKTGE